MVADLTKSGRLAFVVIAGLMALTLLVGACSSDVDSPSDGASPASDGAPRDEPGAGGDESGVADDDFPSDEPMIILGVFGGYCYINASYVRMVGLRAPGGTVEAIDQQFFGESEAPPYVARDGDKDLKATLRLGKKVLQLLRTKELPARGGQGAGHDLGLRVPRVGSLRRDPAGSDHRVPSALSRPVRPPHRGHILGGPRLRAAAGPV